MIKFFRHIRKTLINGGKTSKYFKYAIGEIVLVVIGILIALQINTWNSERKDRVQEQKYLIEIRDNLQADTQEIKVIEKEYEFILSKIDTLLIFIKNAEPQATDYKKLWDIVLDVSYIPSFKTQKNGYNNLISAGNINQIQNSELMKRITSHYSEVDYANELIRQTVFESSQIDLHPEIKKLVSKKDFLSDLGYEFNTTNVTDADLSNNEELIGGILYKKMWVGVALFNTKEWNDDTIELIEYINQFIITDEQ